MKFRGAGFRGAEFGSGFRRFAGSPNVVANLKPGTPNQAFTS